MRVRSAHSSVIFSLLLLLAGSAPAAPTPDAGAAQLLPERVGDFRAAGAPQAVKPVAPHKPEDFQALDSARRNYASAGAGLFSVTLVKARSDSGAYSMLSALGRGDDGGPGRMILRRNDVGTVALIAPGRVAFFKGPAMAVVERAGGGASSDEKALHDFARAFAATLDAGSGEIPALVRHLPDWETAQEAAAYAITLPALLGSVAGEPALEAVSFDAGTEAITAEYGAAGRLVIVEYGTPQIAAESDARINQRIAELRGAGKSVPAVYRRVGNYSVFVFDATDGAAAERLAGQVKYEKDVRWLGNDPHEYARHNRLWINMSASVLVNTVKAAGLAILVCLGVGGLFGALVFRKRRAQAALSESYSDAGGMMRLDLDEHAAKLLGHGEK